MDPGYNRQIRKGRGRGKLEILAFQKRNDLGIAYISVSKAKNGKVTYFFFF